MCWSWRPPVIYRCRSYKGPAKFMCKEVLEMLPPVHLVGGIIVFSAWIALLLLIGFQILLAKSEAKKRNYRWERNWIKPSLFYGIPNGDMLDGTHVQMCSGAQQYSITTDRK
ncbi:uncharacterized protein [Miscanthus floridulus]|uniref:uncharacterized protein isoform X2 n=1 Tax=Miscanthus floridulus TaxID=154761 RepID=UPI00345825AC